MRRTSRHTLRRLPGNAPRCFSQELRWRGCTAVRRLLPRTGHGRDPRRARRRRPSLPTRKAMLKFQEAAKCVSGSIAVSTCPKPLIARRYTLLQKLGSGSFGTVYLVSDKKAKQGEELRILHRDLKSKNIFLKNNLLKIGDFGVSRLLMGSGDLATTLTGTPHYMSPEALKHQGYDTKSDIWSLACILYEMCCMNQAFTGSNFLSIVLKIVEGATPSLPERYPRQLNAIMESMLNKSPSLRPSALEILKIPYIDEQLQHLMCGYSEMTLKDKNLNCQKEAAYIINAMQKKIHLQTLRALSEVQKMTPREKMRLRKVQAADEEAEKLKKLVEEKYEENNKRMQELRSRNFQQLTVDVLHEFDDPASENLPEPQPVPSLDLGTLGSSVQDTVADLGDHEIPEDPLVAEEYYAEAFDSYSEGSEEGEEEKMGFSVREEEVEDEGSQPADRTHQQDSDMEALARCLEHVLGCTTLDTRTVTSSAPDTPSGPTVFNSAMARTKMKRMQESAVRKLGTEVFEEVYGYLKRARQQGASETEVRAALEAVVPRASDCFEVDQLLYFEEQLLITRGDGATLLQNHHEATVRNKELQEDKAL
ncbi:serine/threonine-protein kinase Nek11 isoform X3 [Hippopotamus amphibius kiboko]|uniref:serine/threonine-protein kinase Nek11 isoform X3 n=1 Tax=Hippopotamus amphibius kiboko TaxID=575201 RepID=UPI0025992474|nr:serine/threonine-protein kinase Nek11 isoform X3 [Hippopotamus amphibius kiboko]